MAALQRCLHAMPTVPEPAVGSTGLHLSSDVSLHVSGVVAVLGVGSGRIVAGWWASSAHHVACAWRGARWGAGGWRGNSVLWRCPILLHLHVLPCKARQRADPRSAPGSMEKVASVTQGPFGGREGCDGNAFWRCSRIVLVLHLLRCPRPLNSGFKGKPYPLIPACEAVLWCTQGRVQLATLAWHTLIQDTLITAPLHAVCAGAEGLASWVRCSPGLTCLAQAAHLWEGPAGQRSSRVGQSKNSAQPWPAPPCGAAARSLCRRLQRCRLAPPCSRLVSLGRVLPAAAAAHARQAQSPAGGPWNP